MVTPSKDRVQKYRARRKASGFVRFEVTLNRLLIEAIRKVARQKKVPTWDVVHDALEAFLDTGSAAAADSIHMQNR
jgi:hypothetical protein